MLFNKFNNWLKTSIRLVLTVVVCGMLFISSAYPANAVTSKPSDGEANLNEIQKETDDVARSSPQGIEEVTKRAQKGLNEVQGSADADKMNNPSNPDADTVKEKAANFFDNLTN